MAVPPTNDSYVKIHAIRLPKTQLFCCTRSDVTRCFAPDAFSWVGFGWPSKSFTFDSRSRHRPKIKGIVVAALTVSRTREAHLIFYPCDRSLYPSAATEQFGSQVLARMRSWLEARRVKAETSVLGYKSLIVEWNRDAHRVHTHRYL